MRQALKVDLMDEIVPHLTLLEATVELVGKGSSAHRTLSVGEQVLAGPLGRALLSRITNRKIARKTQGNYSATKRILEVIETGLAQGSSSGYDAEAHTFGELVMTSQSQALRHIFLANTGVKKNPGSDAELGLLNSVGILGGDLMGEGVTYVTTCKGGLPVCIKDINTRGTNHALKYSWDQLETKVRRRHIKASECNRQLVLISGSIDCRGSIHRDLIIEAVFRDLSLKQRTVAEVEQNCAPHTIFASNTSSLPISDIATNTARPEQVIGPHFSSPVERMSLVEVTPCTMTSEQATATTIKLAKKQGKVPIVVRDKAGFYVNRILAPCINEAIRMLTEGERVETMDAVLIKFGFPTGSIQLLDGVGIDADTKIIPVLEAAYGERFGMPAGVVASILNDDRKGRRDSRGLYLYGAKGRRGKKQVDPTIYTLIGVQGQGRLTAAQIVGRYVMLVFDEAARCFDERIIRSTHDGDIGAVFSTGLPSFLGSPFRYMDSLGAGEVITALQRLTT